MTHATFKSISLLLALALLSGCSTGEGPKQYNFGDNYFMTFVSSTNTPVELLVEMYNQRAESATGRDRVTKPSADLTVPISPVP
jgi:hypothetical protein